MKTQKTIRFDEKDEEMIENAREKMPFARSDIDVIRFALYSFLNPAAGAVTAYRSEDDKPSKKPKLSQEGLEDIRHQVAVNGICAAHADKLMSMCGCTEDTPELVDRMIALGYVA